ncbi:hypothetical protein [Flavobacterium sp. WV_118_3]|uniref:hypothetical protein n=1 Tax=Flavobacterium sp. WV_118_3 TaxID=3151764 RepID=UPI00321A5364
MKEFVKRTILLFCFVCTACSVSKSHIEKLVNTKWSYNFGHDDVKSFFVFNDIENYKFYNAETGDTIIGTYFLKKDTVHFNQKYGVFDHEFPENSHHRMGSKKYKMIIKNKNQLGYIRLWDNDTQKWKEDYFFTKE